jgi:arylsulfatase A-like enzyme
VYGHPARLSEDLHLISEAFAGAGYETWFWNGHPMASAELGYGQGIPSERVRASVEASPGPLTPRETLAFSANDAEFDALLDRLRANRDLRAFVQVAFTVTHEPYSNYCTPQMVADFCARFPHEARGLTERHFARYMPIYEQHRPALQWNHAGTTEDLGLSDEDVAQLARVVEVVYKTTIHELDRLFGAFLDRIRARGLYDQSLIAFTSDHGEVLYRDNALFQWTHALQLAPESLDVPWILRAPGAASKRRYEGVTRSIDVFPTLAGLCGIELPEDRGIEGVDLSPALRGGAPEPELLAFSHSTTLSELQSARLKDFPSVTRLFASGGIEGMWVRVRSRDLAVKLRSLDGSRWGIEVFDLASDPQERRNLYEPGYREQEALVEALRAYKERLADAWSPLPPALPTEEELRRLRSLGYVR